MLLINACKCLYINTTRRPTTTGLISSWASLICLICIVCEEIQEVYRWKGMATPGLLFEDLTIHNSYDQFPDLMAY